MTRPHPKARPHGALREVLPDIFFVTGTIALGVGVRFSRSMTVIREGGALTLVNTVRLDDTGLAALDKLGKVTNVIRLAGFHGMDDPFYKERYGARVHTMKGQVYNSGFSPVPKPETAYLKADIELDGNTPLPIQGARLYRFASCQNGEGLLVLDRHNGTIVSGDCLQNWAGPDEFFSFLGKVMTKSGGFMKPHNIGPGWLKASKPDVREIKGILDLTFENVLPAHGEPVIGRAKELYRPVIEALVAAA